MLLWWCTTDTLTRLLRVWKTLTQNFEEGKKCRSPPPPPPPPPRPLDLFRPGAASIMACMQCYPPPLPSLRKSCVRHWCQLWSTSLQRLLPGYWQRKAAKGGLSRVSIMYIHSDHEKCMQFHTFTLPVCGILWGFVQFLYVVVYPPDVSFLGDARWLRLQIKA